MEESCCKCLEKENIDLKKLCHSAIIYLAISAILNAIVLLVYLNEK